MIKCYILFVVPLTGNQGNITSGRKWVVTSHPVAARWGHVFLSEEGQRMVDKIRRNSSTDTIVRCSYHEGGKKFVLRMKQIWATAFALLRGNLVSGGRIINVKPKDALMCEKHHPWRKNLTLELFWTTYIFKNVYKGKFA